MKFKFDDEVVNVTQIRQIGKFARRAAAIGEMEESASHHLCSFAFAQLRAEMPENDARDSRRNAQNWKSRNFGPRSR